MIPVYKPFLGKADRANLIDAFDSSWISSRGEYIDKFERLLCAYTSRKFAVVVNNGTTALHTALSALGIKEGDEVITNSFSYVATANAIKYVGAEPVFVDSCPDSWNLDIQRLKEKINPRTKAIVVANIYGNISGIDIIQKLAAENNLYLIEDAAESIGSSQGSTMSGSFGDISTFSFFGNKTITTGEGGAVLMNCPKLFKRVRQLINQGNSAEVRYFHEILGYNYRMTNLQAAIGVAQLERIDEILERKQKIYDMYYAKLSNYVAFQNLNNTVSSNWLVSILFESANQKNKIENTLLSNNIESRPLFYPIPDLPYFKRNEDETIVARKLRAQGLSLPSYPGLELKELERIINLILTIIK